MEAFIASAVYKHYINLQKSAPIQTIRLTF